MLNVHKIKSDFPIFKKNPDLTYLDSAATSLKPKVMINKLIEYYESYSANIKRGIYKISEKATEEYEKTRDIVANFIGAKNHSEIIFTRSTTESINLVVYGLGRKIINRGDEIAVSIMDHHSNFVPWQQLAFEIGADFKVIEIDKEGRLLATKDFEKIITKKTKILALPYVSNVLGTINPIKEIAKRAKRVNPSIITVIDAAQAVGHMNVDVSDLGCDFLAFSGHKILGPTGVGVLWGKREILYDMFPFQYGGEMIKEVSLNETVFADTPEKFEAGTPAIADVIALKEGILYLQNLGLNTILNHEAQLISYASGRLKEEFGKRITIFGPSEKESRTGVVSFAIGGLHPHDVATILDEKNICIRAGHHCAMPLHKKLGIPASLRASFYIYNDEPDVERLITNLRKAEKILLKEI